VLGGEIVIGQRTPGIKARGADEEVVVDHPVEAGVRMAGSGDLLVPDVRRVGVEDKPCLLVQLPAQCRQQELTGLDTATGAAHTPVAALGTAGCGELKRQSRTRSSSARMIARTARLSLAVAGVSFIHRSSGRRRPGRKPVMVRLTGASSSGSRFRASRPQCG
jgi:hypothetical protein